MGARLPAVIDVSVALVVCFLSVLVAAMVSYRLGYGDGVDDTKRDAMNRKLEEAHR